MSNTVFQLFVLTLKWGLNCNVYLLLIHRIYMHYLFVLILFEQENSCVRACLVCAR